MPPAGVDHRCNGEGHAFLEFDSGARFAVMQNLRILVVHPADSVPTILPDHRKIVALGIALDGMSNIAQMGSRLDHAYAAPHGLVAGDSQAPGQHAGVADEVHAAGVPMKTLANHSHVDVDDVAVFQALVAGNPVAHHVIDRGAYGLGEAAVVEIGGDRLKLVHNEVVAAPVELLGAYPRQHERLDHIEHAGRQAPGAAHFVPFDGVFDRYIHWLKAWFPLDLHGIKRGYF